MRSISTCAMSPGPRRRLTRRSSNTCRRAVRNEPPPVLGMCRKSTGLGRDSLSASTRFGECSAAKDLDVIAAHLLFYSRNAITARTCRRHVPSLCHTLGGHYLARHYSHLLTHNKEEFSSSKRKDGL